MTSGGSKVTVAAYAFTVSPADAASSTIEIGPTDSLTLAHFEFERIGAEAWT